MVMAAKESAISKKDLSMYHKEIRRSARLQRYVGMNERKPGSKVRLEKIDSPQERSKSISVASTASPSNAAALEQRASVEAKGQTLLPSGRNDSDSPVHPLDANVLELAKRSCMIKSVTTAEEGRNGNNRQHTIVAPEPRSRCGGVIYNNNLYLFGGSAEGSTGDVGKQLRNDIMCYNLSAKQWSHLECGGFFPKPRIHHSILLKDHKLVIYGGIREDGHILNDMFAISLKEVPHLWKKVAVFVSSEAVSGSTRGDNRSSPISFLSPPALFQHSAVLHPIRNSMIIFGGRTTEGVSSHMHEFCFSTQEWRRLRCGEVHSKKGYLHTLYDNDQNPLLYGHSVAIYENSMFVYGGYTSPTIVLSPEEQQRAVSPSAGGKELSHVNTTVFAFDFGNGTWRVVEQFSLPKLLADTSPDLWEAQTSFVANSFCFDRSAGKVIAVRNPVGLVQGSQRQDSKDLVSPQGVTSINVGLPCFREHMTWVSSSNFVAVFGGEHGHGSLYFGDVFVYHFPTQAWAVHWAQPAAVTPSDPTATATLPSSPPLRALLKASAYPPPAQPTPSAPGGSSSSPTTTSLLAYQNSAKRTPGGPPSPKAPQPQPQQPQPAPSTDSVVFNPFQGLRSPAILRVRTTAAAAAAAAAISPARQVIWRRNHLPQKPLEEPDWGMYYDGAVVVAAKREAKRKAEARRRAMVARAQAEGFPPPPPLMPSFTRRVPDSLEELLQGYAPCENATEVLHCLLAESKQLQQLSPSAEGKSKSPAAGLKGGGKLTTTTTTTSTTPGHAEATAKELKSYNRVLDQVISEYATQLQQSQQRQEGASPSSVAKQQKGAAKRSGNRREIATTTTVSTTTTTTTTTTSTTVTASP